MYAISEEFVLSSTTKKFCNHVGLLKHVTKYCPFRNENTKHLSIVHATVLVYVCEFISIVLPLNHRF